MVLTEAMSLGRPFVSTPVGGIPELADEGGMLVAVDDEIGLADRLTDLLADPQLARRIGERGRRFCSGDKKCRGDRCSPRDSCMPLRLRIRTNCSGMSSGQCFGGAQQTNHRQPVAAQHSRATAQRRSCSLLFTVVRLLIQYLTGWKYLAPYERAKSSLGCQQSVDKPDVCIELGLAGVGIGIGEPHGDARPRRPSLCLSPMICSARQAHRLLGGFGGSGDYAPQLWIFVQELFERAGC